jgi:hypothetical protein
MALQIQVDPTALSSAQRKYLAEFLLNFPASCSGSGACHTAPVPPVAVVSPGAAPVDVKSAEALQEMAEKSAKELSQLAAEASQPATAAEAFGNRMGEAQAAAAFGTPGNGQALTTTTPESTLGTNAPGAATATSTVTTGPVSSGAGASPAGSVDLDSAGLPWDNRIHSSGKTKVANGTWTKKRGVSPETLASVEAQLRAVMAVPAGGVQAGNASTPAATVSTPPPAPPASANSGTASASGSAVPPPPTGDDPKAQYAALVKACTEAAAAGKITGQEITDICQRHGGPGLVLPLLVNRLDLVGAVYTDVNALLLSR